MRDETTAMPGPWIGRIEQSVGLAREKEHKWSMSRRWIGHTGHDRASWAGDLRREVVAAYRRGTMDAARCLGTYRIHGERSVLPPEAVVYLATRVVAGVSGDLPIWERYDGWRTCDVLREHGERELAGLVALGGDDDEAFQDLVEAGRRFFFPGPIGRG